MNCPICGKPLEINATDDLDKNIAIAAVECLNCQFNVLITWPHRQEQGVLIATPTEVIALN